MPHWFVFHAVPVPVTAFPPFVAATVPVEDVALAP